MSNAHDVVRLLCKEKPNLHGDTGSHQWGLAPKVLEWIATHARHGTATIETGCGYSTLVFAAAGCQHTVISPSPREHQRIRDWGQQHGVDLSHVTFIMDRSETVLPTLETPPLSIALIDGWHGFPGPYLDWFFMSRLMAVGGYVLVDDVHIRACEILRDFLQTERGRWESCGQIYRTAIFKKCTDALFPGDWNTQPFNASPRYSLGQRVYRSVCSPVIRVAKGIPGVSQVLEKIRPAVHDRWGNDA